jgi:hypothetical protein
MSDMRMIAFLLAAATLGVGSRVTAQSRAGASDSLLRRVLTLDSVLVDQRRTFDSLRRSLVRPASGVAVSVGPVRVLAPAELESRVRRAAGLAAALVAAAADSGITARVASHVSIVTPDSARALFGMSPVLLLRPDTTRTWVSARVSAPATATSAQLADHLITFAERFALEGADSVLAGWVMRGRVPLRPSADEELRDVYVEMATAGSAAVRQCRAGDAASCLDVLGVDSLPGTRLERWYAEADYRDLLRRAAPPADDSVAVSAWIRCRRGGDPAACIAAVRALPADRIPLPLGASARFTFLRDVLDAGGRGAYERLRVTDGSLAARFAHAANRPLDVVTRRWLDRVEEARPGRMQVTPTVALASLGWCGALLAVAILRRRS